LLTKEQNSGSWIPIDQQLTQMKHICPLLSSPRGVLMADGWSIEELAPGINQFN
jgi:hypothetical protein